ncbi:MAG: S9 family peptidase [Bacteroidetes bacterium]|nr:S9 family peptidase [Bacteroidota bacterium]
MKKISCLLIAASVLNILVAQTKSRNVQSTTLHTKPMATDVMQTAFTPEVLQTLKRVSEARLSPDGASIIYNLRTMDINENKGNSDIYRINMDGTNNMAVANGKGNESSAKFIDGGKRIAYLDDTNGSAQVWEMNADGSDKKQITNVDGGVTGFGYSPQLNYIWYSADVKLDKNPAEIYMDLPKVKDARIIDGLMYRHWNVWHDYTYSHVFVQGYNKGAITGSPMDVMPNEKWDCPIKPDGGEEQITFSHDGLKLYYASRKLQGTAYTKSTNSDIYEYTITSGSTRNLTDGMPGYDMDPVCSPNGKYLFWLSMEKAGYEADRNRLMMYDLATGNKKELLINFDYSVTKVVVNAQSTKLYFIAGMEATYQVLTYSLAGKDAGTMRKITNVRNDIQDISISGDDKNTLIIAPVCSHSMPTEVCKIDIKTGIVNKVTGVNNTLLQSLKLARTEKRMVKTTDGKSMLTWVVYPPDFDSTKTYPALLYCQGGPQSTVSQFFSYRWNFQLMAAMGYIVVAPNRRGLPSFGEEWNDAIQGEHGGQAITDLLSAIDDVATEKYVDKNRLGCVGASYGGYSAFYIAGNHNKRFKAFIAHCGIYNTISMYGQTEETWFVDNDYDGPYWKKPQPKSYTVYNPANYIDKWDTPILIIHNERDYRVPLAQGMEAFNAAQLRNIPSRFLYFPDEGHWVTKPQNSILWQREFFRWLDDHLKK